MESNTSLSWGAALALPDPNKGNRAALLASDRWAQRLPRPSRPRALQVSRGEAGGTDREECRGALRGSPSCPGRSRRPGLRMSVCRWSRGGIALASPRQASLRTHNKPTCAGPAGTYTTASVLCKALPCGVRAPLVLAHRGNRSGN